MVDYDRLRNVIVQKLKARPDDAALDRDSSGDRVDDREARADRADRADDHADRADDHADRADARAPLRTVSVSAPTLYAALRRAADRLACDLSKVMYRIIGESGDVYGGDRIVTIRASARRGGGDTDVDGVAATGSGDDFSEDGAGGGDGAGHLVRDQARRPTGGAVEVDGVAAGVGGVGGAADSGADVVTGGGGDVDAAGGGGDADVGGAVDIGGASDAAGVFDAAGATGVASAPPSAADSVAAPLGAGGSSGAGSSAGAEGGSLSVSPDVADGRAPSEAGASVGARASQQSSSVVTADAHVPPAYSIKKQIGQILVRVDPAHAEFSRLRAAELHGALQQRTGHSVDMDKVAAAIKNADNAYHLVATFEHRSLQDAVYQISYGVHNLVANLVLTPPGKYGSELSERALERVLRQQQIVHGIRHDLLRDIEEYPHYNYPYLVAHGTAPLHGKDARIERPVELQLRTPEFDPEARVNHKNRNPIVNVTEGATVARLIPATQGQDGKDVFGNTIRAKPGQQRAIRVGRNVVLEDDDRRAVATADGQLRVIDYVFSVDPIYEVRGDVGVKTGNILFLGSVVVRGNVDDGFSVRASGPIEIYGFVGAAELDSEVGIKIRRGVAGKGKAVIHSDGDCSAQYVEQATVRAVGSIFVSEAIIQSTIVAGEGVFCTGKRANISGGTITSGLRVVAKTIGSPTGAQTHVHVGLDPFLLMRLQALRKRQGALSEQIRHLKLMQRKHRSQLPEEGDGAKMSKMEHVQKETAVAARELTMLEEDIRILNEEIVATQGKGEICVTHTLHAHVEIDINRVTKVLQQDYLSVCFSAAHDKIVSTVYTAETRRRARE